MQRGPGKPYALVFKKCFLRHERGDLGAELLHGRQLLRTSGSHLEFPDRLRALVGAHAELGVKYAAALGAGDLLALVTLPDSGSGFFSPKRNETLVHVLVQKFVLVPHVHHSLAMAECYNVALPFTLPQHVAHGTRSDRALFLLGSVCIGLVAFQLTFILVTLSAPRAVEAPNLCLLRRQGTFRAVRLGLVFKNKVELVGLGCSAL